MGHALDVPKGKFNNPDDPGEINHFQALSTALSSTVGMGNIAGVAVAITLGRPEGAIFWLWVSAFVGMATKFFTNTLAVSCTAGKDTQRKTPRWRDVLYRRRPGKEMEVSSCPFQYQLGWLAPFLFFNVNQLTQAINFILLEPNDIITGLGTNLIIGIVLVILTSVVILGGIQRISKTVSRLVPAMIVLYFISGYSPYLWSILRLFLNIFCHDFYRCLLLRKTIKGNPMLGGVLGGLIILGIRRGAFSNEAGIGTATMAHGASQTSEPIREKLCRYVGARR